jgi:hypothetical protein
VRGERVSCGKPTHASAARQKWRAPCSSLCKGRDTFGVSAACTCWLDASGLHGTNPLNHYRFRDFTPTTAARQSALSTAPSKLTRQLRHNASGALAITPTACVLGPCLIVGSTLHSPTRLRYSPRRRQSAATEGRIPARGEADTSETLRLQLPTSIKADGGVRRLVRYSFDHAHGAGAKRRQPEHERCDALADSPAQCARDRDIGQTSHQYSQKRFDS